MTQQLEQDTQSASSDRLEMNYPEALLKIWRFTDDESTRYQLGFVRMLFASDYAEATNGRILVRERLGLDDAFKQCDTTLFYGRDLKRIARFFEEPSSRFKLKLVLESNAWYAENEDVQFRIQTDDGRFPDTNAIFSIKPARVAKFTINMHELRRFIAAYGVGTFEPGVDVHVPLSGETTLMISPSENRSVDAHLCLMGKFTNDKTIVIEPPFDSADRT